MTTTIMRAIFKPKALAVAIALGCSAQAQAVSFNIGEVEGQFDSSLSLGASFGTQSPSESLISVASGGHGQAATGDDNRLNFKKGDAYSEIFKGVHDLQLKWGDSGIFIRGKYWYDAALQNRDQDFKNVENDGRKEAAKSSGYELLDAFVYHNYNIANLPGTVRLGNQVVSWGESTFIGNSINSINPIDVSAFRRPGSEIKEGLIPVPMLFSSQSLTDKLSIEGFYQLRWRETVVDNCGTFFGNDVVAEGCNNNYTVGSPAIAPAAPIAALYGQPITVTSEGVVVPRGSARDPKNTGQYGFALRWLGDDTEYGAYFENLHANIPVLSTKTASLATFSAIPNIYGTTNAIAGPAAASGLAQSVALGNGQYYLEYPEDVHLLGLSFATTLPEGTAWSGEVSYRPNAPVQLNTTDLTLALLNPIAGGTASPIASAPGQDNKGYRRKEITQVQSTLTHFFDQVLGAERLTIIGEAAVVYVGGLESHSELRYGRDSVYGAYGYNGDTGGYVSATSYGYRARAILDYANLFAGINVKPNLSWSQDVKGYGPNGLFNQGAKALSTGIDADYRNTYTASVSYTSFWGGHYNTLIDRDFASVSVGVNF